MDNKLLSLYDVEKRGSTAPNYTPSEDMYRTNILNLLQLAYNTREQTHEELNDKSYSEYYLINRQQDMAYNPPKKNPSDSRVVTGIIHEKDTTVQAIIDSMNLQPTVKFYDTNNPDLLDLGNFLTAKIRKSFTKEGFREKLSEFLRINISQGNVFTLEQRTKKYETRKIPVGNPKDPFKMKWNTVVEQCDEYCESIALPNTTVFMPNLLESDIKKQPYLFVVMQVPTITIEQMYKDFPRFKNIPKYPTKTVPPNTDGLWGDFYLQQPQQKYSEVIIYQNKPQNEYQIFINGVMMLPIDEVDGRVVGFPLTYFSPSGEYTIVKGDNEKIPFFAYAKSLPTKNEVKEEIANEFLRIATHKFRYSAFPSIGNNADKILPANIWDPSIVIPDLDEKDFTILNPEGKLTQADFSFYSLIMNSIDETSVSKSLEGSNNEKVTATQYVDQKRENLKKLGVSIDGAINLIRDIAWLRLLNEIFYLDTKKKTYSPEEKRHVEIYESFIADTGEAGDRKQTRYNLVDEMPEVDVFEMFKEEFQNPLKEKNVYIKPKDVKEFLQKVKDTMYIEVTSEPEGQNQSLLGVLFNNLTAYSNLRGGIIPNLNFEYIDKIIDENSGFQSNKLFLKIPVQNVDQMQQPMMGQEVEGVASQAGVPGVPQRASKPKPPTNSVLANSA
jgi:hypothetical protein